MTAGNRSPHEETPGIACGGRASGGLQKKGGKRETVCVNTGDWNKKSEAVMVASCGG